ncbi:LacI family DNA-binding transcriptional regulator [Microbacterium sp. B2969]|uniref:LacI family DNA-binding transcriptional regulator n=1 Tax=Microbacterium alkaliflavum TaxID=3248839 RepID=A0ABW7QF20_9MICO
MGSVERVTIAQVAAEAGVSSMTVSNVVNGRPGASDATRERVLEVAARLGYQVNLSARSLRSGRTGLIGIISLDLVSEYSHEIMRGVAESVVDDERELLLNVSVDAVRERDRIEFFARDLVDGVLLIAPVLEPATVAMLESLDVPVVVIDPRRLDVPLPRVTVDNYEGVRAGTEHLIGLGHRRIGYIRGDEDLESTLTRQRGYLDAMKLAGLPVDDDLLAESGFSHEAGFRAGQQLLERAEPTAIIAGADLIAFGAMDAARARGLDVPRDLSIVGFDDLPRAAHTYPPLTTVRQPLHDMGQAGTRALLSLIEGRPLAVENIRMPTTLIVRGSTAVAR